MLKKLAPYAIYLAWVQALVATVGSLFFSEVMKLPPCVFCWYQRIFMYPLTIIIPIAILRKDKQNLPFYVLPLVLLGSVFATYHNLLYYKIIPEYLTPCSAGISCTTKYFEWFGFITIPFLSLMAFVLIGVLMVIFAFSQRSGKEDIKEEDEQ